MRGKVYYKRIIAQNKTIVPDRDKRKQMKTSCEKTFRGSFRDDKEERMTKETTEEMAGSSSQCGCVCVIEREGVRKKNCVTFEKEAKQVYSISVPEESK